MLGIKFLAKNLLFGIVSAFILAFFFASTVETLEIAKSDLLRSLLLVTCFVGFALGFCCNKSIERLITGLVNKDVKEIKVIAFMTLSWLVLYPIFAVTLDPFEYMEDHEWSMIWMVWLIPVVSGIILVRLYKGVVLCR